MSQADKWSEYWQQEGRAGEVFVGKDGSPHPKLAEFWKDQFNRLDPGERIIDLACGAGSIFSHIENCTSYELHASDLSEEAVRLLRNRVPAVLTSVSSAAAPPYRDKSFDLVVSQFGVEYAGTGAFDNAARLVGDKGRLVMLCHYRDGVIDSTNQALLAGARVAKSSGFIDKAIALARAAFSSSRPDFDAAASAFSPPERALAAAVREFDGGVHSHLYAGFRQLFEHREAYDLEDITDWLTAMAGDVDRNIARLSAMRDAALSSADAERIAATLRDQGFLVDVKPFKGSNQAVPVAWHLSAQRAQQSRDLPL